MRIGLDAMGGDRAPRSTVEGAVMAVNEYGYHLTLIGSEDVIRKHLKEYSFPSDKIDVVHTSQQIEMHEPAALSVRKKRDDSWRLSFLS